MPAPVFFQFYFKYLDEQKYQIKGQQSKLEKTKLLRRTSFSLKPMIFFPMAFKQLLALLQRVEMCCSKNSLLSISISILRCF